jgi:sulfite exporter TauE/SafE
LLFKKNNLIWMAAGALLIIIGLALMSGGRMPDPNTWDPDIIYSFRRTVLAPIVILAGLGLEIYAIFKK